jgi:iron(III) transport system permease protein
VTAVAVAAGLVVAWAVRTQGSTRSRGRWTGRVATLGYAVAGTVLAIGLLTPALAVDAAAWDTTAQG